MASMFTWLSSHNTTYALLVLKWFNMFYKIILHFTSRIALAKRIKCVYLHIKPFLEISPTRFVEIHFRGRKKTKRMILNSNWLMMIWRCKSQCIRKHCNDQVCLHSITRVPHRCFKHVEAVTNWPSFPRRQFEIDFLEWKCTNFYYDFTEVRSLGYN